MRGVICGGRKHINGGVLCGVAGGLMSQGDREMKEGDVSMTWVCGGQICARSSAHSADAQTTLGAWALCFLSLCLSAHMSMYLQAVYQVPCFYLSTDLSTMASAGLG